MTSLPFIYYPVMRRSAEDCTEELHQVERAKDVVFNLFTILFFGSVLYSAWLQPSWSTVVPVLAGVFCALIGNPDRFASIKFSLSGIEAKAREIIQKVEVSQREFQNIATMVGELFVELNASVGRWDTGSGAERDKRKSRVLDALQSIGLSEQELVRISSIDKPWNIIDYVNGIITRAAKAVPKDLKTEWNEIVTPILISRDKIAATTPESLREIFARFDVLDARINDLIEDYAHYLRSGEQRRPSVWSDRYAW